MRNFCLIGETLKHSMSPQIHKALFDLSDKVGEYTLKEIKKDNFVNDAQKLKLLNGYNITIPYKVDIIPFIDEIDESAKRYGAVNCVYNKDGKSYGYNTDVYGFLESLNSNNIKLDGKVLLLGLGGVGRMMAMETVLAGGKLTVAVRKSSFDKSEKIKKDILLYSNKSTIDIIEYKDIKGHFDTIINSTPVGMYPHSEECPVSDEVIRNCDSVFDAIYNPVKTKLISKALEYGKTAVGGMEMLVYQAVMAHKIWDDADYSVKDIKEVITTMEKEVSKNFR